MPLVQAEGGPVYNSVASGQIAGSSSTSTPKQLPNIPCRMVQFAAAKANSGNFYLGGAGVTEPSEGTDTTTGIQIPSGGKTSWIRVDNLNRLYVISDNTGDFLAYLVLN